MTTLTQPSTHTLTKTIRVLNTEQQIKYIDLHDEVECLLQEMQRLKVRRQLEGMIQESRLVPDCH
ncbi:MAG: hypothetical protein AAGG51_12985 [Cyanobacteria bacterium P01_G01_bin.54]